RWRLEREPERIALLQQSAGSRPDLVLVFLSVGQIRDEQLPDADRREQPHRVHAAIPPVEVANHTDPLGVRRPYREVHTGGAADADAVRPELVERPMMRALAEQVQTETGGA